MHLLDQFQSWYLSHCNGEWEHQAGIKIETLNNPGWLVKISLRGTELENKPFEEIARLQEGPEWLHCSVKEGTFEGAAGAQQLEEILQIFLSWAKTA